MAKIYPTKPFLILLYGYPGAGKTYFARQFSENIQAAHIQADKIRGELFEQPRYDQQENTVVSQIMDYMTEEFLAAGLSVVYDVNATRFKERRMLYNVAHKYKAMPFLVWFQMDQETAFARNIRRDKRRADDKFAAAYDRTSFDSVIANMQNPTNHEDYIVVSGKHLFNMQQSSVVGRLRQKGVLAHDDASSRVIKPGLVNLIPKAPTNLDNSRRNISIR
jgi:predicted kinase